MAAMSCTAWPSNQSWVCLSSALVASGLSSRNANGMMISKKSMTTAMQAARCQQRSSGEQGQPASVTVPCWWYEPAGGGEPLSGRSRAIASSHACLLSDGSTGGRGEVPDLPIEPNTSHRTLHHLAGVRFRPRRLWREVLREHGGV